MYNEFYGFKSPPFNLTPDPRFLFMSDRHREAYNHLLFGIRERKGFIQLTGEVGAGKTTLCRALLESLGTNFTTALILNPCLTELQLLGAILDEFGLKAPRQDRVSRLDTLNKFLLDEAAQGRDVVLIIDEAQDLSMELLEQVRLLSNLETDERKLLQIVLMGQPELRNKLNDHRLRQLRQRITVRYHLTPLSREEMGLYIRHRIHISGGNGRPSFSSWALRKVFGYSKGTPRLINAVCDKTLLCGFVSGVDHFKRSHVARAIRELEGKLHMSLVNQALQKVRAQQAQQNGASGNVLYHMAPPRRTSFGLVPFVVGTILLGGVALAVWLGGFRLHHDQAGLPSNAAVARAAVPITEDRSAIEIAKPHDAPMPVVEVSPIPKSPAPPGAALPVAQAIVAPAPVPATQPAKPTIEPETIAAVPPVVVAEPTPPVAAPPAAPVPAKGPVLVNAQTLDVPGSAKIKLNAISHSENGSRAVINNTVVEVGDEIETATVVSIEGKRVQLKIDQNTFTLRMP